METIKQWALSLLATCIVTAVVGFLVPSGKFEKTLKILTSLFLIFGFCIPLTKLDINTQAFDETNGIKTRIDEKLLEEEIEKEVVQVLENEIKNQITLYLSQRNISFTEIIPEIKIDADQNIEIISIIIKLNDMADINIIENFVYQRFGIVPEVDIESGVSYGNE